jgi:ubiquinone/menaquinone biosynthesis C-methylase UbiE
MKLTDYSKIAPRYDKNPIRHSQPREKFIDNILKSSTSAIYVLDLACGTGNYILAQQNYYKQKRIHWYGCDLSEDMLNIAKDKVKNTRFQNANAEMLPYQSNQFDLITCNWAFHHFVYKNKAVREIYRVLKRNGAVILKNISPELMPLWWIYGLFPSTKQNDKNRYWSNKKLFSKFEENGFEVEEKITVTMKRQSFDEMFKEAKNRDSSQLTLIGEDEYKRGLKRITEMKNQECMTQFAFLELIGTKKK